MAHLGGFWQPTEDDNMRCSRMTQVCHKKRSAICFRSSCKWLLQVRPFATVVYFTFLAFQCCQMLSKKQPWQWPLALEKKTRHLNEMAKHRNQVCKTRHESKSASLKLLQLAPRSFCHAADGIWEQWSKYNFSKGEMRKTSSRSAAPSAPLVAKPKHLECPKGDCEDIQPPGRWHIQKGTFVPSKPQSSKNLAFVRGRPYYHLDGAKCKQKL